MIQLKYPVFIFTKDDPMVYVFHNDYDFRTTTSKYVERTNVKNDMFIDSSGMKYFPQTAYITHVWSLRERLLRLTTAKLVTIGYKYEDAEIPITLDELKEMIMSRYPESVWFDSTWVDVEEFKDEMSKCNTFYRVALLFGKPHPIGFFKRLPKGSR